jgi:ketosteroid isomerase-like protein
VRILHSVDEDEVIAAFVHGELGSPRYGERVRELFERHGGDVHAVLGKHRAWRRDEGLFMGFPADVRWFRAALDPDEVLDILYINWDWWLRISAGSRRPRDAAERIRAGLIPGITAESHELYADPADNPPLIAVRTGPGGKLVLLEGHARLTAYALYPEYLPPELEIYLGESPQMERWSELGSAGTDPLGVVLEHFASFARDDEKAHAATYAQECVIEEPDVLPWGGVYRGRDGQRRLVERYDEAWNQVQVTPLEYTRAGELVYALVSLDGETASGSSVDMLTIECFRVGPDGIVEQRVFYWDTAALARAF